ncbi:hypothetical protein OG21DRAFT_1144611 [Imleria badia]|nr:hypothetical protein OG21DRAFT_1144611 [Imleria badia]
MISRLVPCSGSSIVGCHTCGGARTWLRPSSPLGCRTPVLSTGYKRSPRTIFCLGGLRASRTPWVVSTASCSWLGVDRFQVDAESDGGCVSGGPAERGLTRSARRCPCDVGCAPRGALRVSSGPHSGGDLDGPLGSASDCTSQCA